MSENDLGWNRFDGPARHGCSENVWGVAATTMIPLRVRSYYSLQVGTASPEILCSKAQQYGYQQLALTDTGNLYGLWPFINHCRRLNLKPIIGAELGGDSAGRDLCCLVQNPNGYRNLCNLLTASRLGTIGKLSELAPEKFDGLLVLVRDQVLIKKLREQEISVVADLGNRPTAAGSRLLETAKKMAIPAVATPDSCLAGVSDFPLSQLIEAVREKKIVSSNTSPRRGEVLPILEKPAVYRQRFAMWPEVIRATHEIAERCSFAGPDFGIVMPPWEPAHPRSAPRVLRQEAYQGARNRYGGDLREAVVERLEHELRVIEEMGYCSYFLVVRDIVQPRQADGTRTTRRICGRGSGAASLVAYCLGITNVCPLRYTLYFERFLNPARKDPPDIDIDFAWDERDQVLGDLFETFGDRAAMVCNHVFCQPRLAIRETARAFGLPGYEISRMTKRLPWFFQGDDEAFSSRLARLPSLKDQDFAAPWPEIITRASGLVGLPRYLSVHPGGVVITPTAVADYVPVERSAKGVRIIQWEKDGTQQAGLVKIDLLGNRSLGVIRDAVENVRHNGVALAEHHWAPEDDCRTQEAVRQGRTMGCFYIESPAMRLLQKKAATGDFKQLVIQSSIIRPAANEFVREYVRRLHGGAWESLHPALEQVLAETFGLMVYQEDVTNVAVALAGFSYAEADGLRKVISKKDRHARLHDYQEAFFSGCRKQGMKDPEIERIWAMMISFSGYSFCKAHSASYARVSFQAAYLKTHYPAEFMAAVISNQGGFYSTFAYVSEARRMAIEIVPPDVNQSDYYWQGREKSIRVGLQAIRELSFRTATTILAQRQHQVFSGFHDFLQRAKPAAPELRSLINAGACDGLEPSKQRSELLWEAAGRTSYHRQNGPKPLFEAPPLAPPLLPRQNARELLRAEYRALGFLSGMHPMCLMGHSDTRLLIIKAEALPEYVGRTVCIWCWLLTGKMVATKRGEIMEFLTFEDETGLVETTFFPKVYRAHAHQLSSGQPYFITGLVEADYGAVTLSVAKVLDRKQ